jgi:hypothetical protein
MTLRTGRRVLIGVLAAAALACAAAPAGASSLVYVKDGNVWLTDRGHPIRGSSPTRSATACTSSAPATSPTAARWPTA